MAEPFKPPPSRKPSFPEIMRTVSPYMNIGWMLVLSILFWAFVGYWVDRYFQTRPLFLAIGAVLGIVVGMYHFLMTVLRDTRKDTTQDEQSR